LEPNLEGSFFKVGSRLTHKHLPKLKRFAWNKHSSLLETFVKYKRKKFYNIASWRRVDMILFLFCCPRQGALAEGEGLVRLTPHLLIYKTTEENQP